MSGGGKSSTSTSTVSIPPEVLARYNAVNARAEQVAQQPFTPYGGEFVAPLTQTQQAGIANVNQAAGAAQPYYQAAGTALLGGASQAQPYYQAATEGLYGGQAAAAPLQQAAAGNIYGAQAGAQPYQALATGYGLAGARQVTPGGLNIPAYMSPYTEAVAQPTYQALRQQQQQEQQKLLGDQIRAGAFGGDRGKIAQATLAQQQNLATAQALGNIYQQGYGQALGAAQQQQGVALAAEQANRQAQQQAAQQFLGIGQQGFGQGMTAAQQQAALAQQLYGQGATTAQQAAALGQGLYGIGAGVSQGLAGLGTGAQQAALQGGQAQLAAGTVAQQTQQAQNQALYNQFLQQQGYPFQVAQFLANIAMGTGALSGSTTTTTQPQSFFSDERLKQDIEPIGKTYDGQEIVRFKYKGEPGTRIGLVAQDVEKHHPDAVGLAGGYKTVDYDKATDEAAERAPHKAYGGGLSPWEGGSMGGSVFREDAGAGFAAGGAPGQDDLLAQINAIVNSHQGMYPYGKVGMYGSSLGKGGPYGSSLMQVNPRLMTAPPPRQEAPYGARQAMRDVKDIAEMPRTVSGAYSGIRGGLLGTPETTREVTSPSGQVSREVTQEASGGLLGRGGQFAWEGSYPQQAAQALTEAAQSAGAFFGMAHGGAVRSGLAAGGLPYSNAEDEYVPEDISAPMKPAGLQPAKPPAQGRTTGDDIMSMAKLAAMAAAFSSGGLVPRKGYTDGGNAGVVPEGYLDFLSGRESGGRPDATNSEFPPDRGGPVGRYQFTAPTFLELARGDPRFEGKSDAEILAERTNPAVSAAFADRYARANAQVLQNAGFEPTRENLALAHMQGPGGAPALLRSPERNVVDVLTDVYGNRDRALAVVNQNRGNPDMTAAQFTAHLVGGRPPATTEAPAPGLAAPAAAAPTAAAGLLPRAAVRPQDETSWLERRLERNQNWLVPLLSGLGAMASSPSRYLGSAILQGLAGGAQTYAGMGQRQEELALQRGSLAERQQATNINAAARSLELLRFMQSRFTPFSRPNPQTGSLETMYRDQVTGRILNESDYQREMATYSERALSLMSPTGGGASATGAAAPAGAAPGLAPPSAPAPAGAAPGLAPPSAPAPSEGAAPRGTAPAAAPAAPPSTAAAPTAGMPAPIPATVPQQVGGVNVDWARIDPTYNPHELMQRRNALYATLEHEKRNGFVQQGDQRWNTLITEIEKYDDKIKNIVTGATPMLRTDGTLDTTYSEQRAIRDAEAAGQRSYEERVAATAAEPTVTSSGARVLPAPAPYVPTTRRPPAAPQQGPAAGETAAPGAAPSAAPPAGQTTRPRAELAPNTAAVLTSIPRAPEGGGYPVTATRPGERVVGLSRTAEQQATADADYFESAGRLPSADNLISRFVAMGDALKLFESGALSNMQQFWARYIQSVAGPELAESFLNGNPSAIEWLQKNTVQGVLEDLSTMKPNFAQREFSATLSQGTPSPELTPRANFAMLTEGLGRSLRMRAWQTDWEEAKQQGWQSPSAFFEVWSRQNPDSVFKQAASRMIGNIRGTSLPSAENLVPGQIYVMPQNADAQTRRLFGNIQPNQAFRFNGFGRPIETVRPEDMLMRRVP